MVDKDQERMDAGWLQGDDSLDRELETALMKYTAAEPRAGLEERVLASLRAESVHVANRAWRRWGAVVALAAVVVVAVALAWRSRAPSHPTVANHPLSTIQGVRAPQNPLASDGTVGRHHPLGPDPKRKRIQHSFPATVAAAHPKLDQFPSAQPLSEQEKILASYVSQYPEHAALIARARMEALRRDEDERNASGNDRDLGR